MISKWLCGLPRAVSQSLFWTLLIIVSTSLLLSENIRHATNFKDVYRDTNFQLSAAINASLCHTQHFLDPNIVKNMRSGLVTDNTRLFALPGFNHISLQAYCSQFIKDMPTTVRLEKNFDVAEGLPLYWVDKAFIKLFGNVTLLQLNILYRLLQVLLTAVFSFYLLTIGVRWPSVWLITLFANFINTLPFIQAMNIHGFILPFSLAIVALYGLSMRFSLYRRYSWHLGLTVVISALELWLFYGRSSQVFALIAVNIIYIFYLLRKSDKKYWVVPAFLAVKLITMTALCYLALIELGPKSLTRTHPVIHSVVLGMAAPENSLSKQQGIKWKDAIGLTVAQRLNPRIDTLYTPEYNAALTNWYVSLWKNDAGQMWSLYYLKFYYVPQAILNKLASYVAYKYKINLHPLFYPFIVLNGFLALLIMLIAVFYYLREFMIKLASGSYVVLSLLILSFLNLLENALISSVFSPRFQTIFIFSFLTWVYVFWGSVVYGSIALWKKYQVRRNENTS